LKPNNGNLQEDFTMSPAKWFVGTALLAFAAHAHAHAHLTASMPVDGSTGKAPEQVVLTFSQPASITAMTLQREGEEAHKVAPLIVRVLLTHPLVQKNDGGRGRGMP
jgi:methionine-rich copper-binding protein CopC